MKALLFLTVLLSSVGAQAAKTNPEEKWIREVVNKFQTAWNAHDTKTMASIWADDATIINPQGRRANGRKEIEKMFQDEHTTIMKGTTATFNVETFRFRGGFAFVDIGIEITGMTTPEGKTLEPQKMHVAALLTKMGKGWWWLDARPYAFLPPPSEVAAKN